MPKKKKKSAKIVTWVGVSVTKGWCEGSLNVTVALGADENHDGASRCRTPKYGSFSSLAT
jgi:hypothetical protein